MRTTSFIAALLASTALAACGGGEEPAADTAESTDTGAMESDSMETEATEASAEDAAEDAADDMEAAAEDSQDAVESAADDAEAAMGDMADEAEAAAEDAAAEVDEAAADMSGDSGTADDGTVTVAGFTGNAADGRRVWTRCASCHVFEEGVNRVGPSMYGIFGRTAGSVEGFRYSEANANSGVVWTAETMFEYLENPREYIPGTIMAFPGLRDPQDRVDVIAYMKESGGLGDEG